MKKVINFGILGPGKIAHRFAAAFQYVPESKVHAIASRDPQKGKEFANLHGVEKCYTSYEGMIQDPSVDVIYIATPHPFHHAQTLFCLKHGKPVLCEKPMAMNYQQALEMIALAKETKTFFMEGMWSRFFPATHKALELIHSGVIGEIKYLEADFGFASPVNHESRVYKLSLGGGAQLDVGVYPMFFALLVLGKPKAVKAFSELAITGADTTTTALLSFESGAIAQIFSSIVTDSPKEAHILGTLGRITLHAPWHKSQQVSLRLNSGETTDFPFPHSGNGFEFQLAEVARCIQEKKLESEGMPHSLSLLMAEVSDEIRRQGGIKYAEDE